MNFTRENIPDQTGKTAVVTGANAGLGYETALALVKKGARVVLACRSKERGEEARKRIEAENPSGLMEVMLLDLSSLESVRAFADAFYEKHEALDLLVNNAGLMVPPEGKTVEGFELQFGVNVLGHFALTGLLFEALEKGKASRVVWLSSLAHRNAELDFSNLRGEKPYKPMREYGQSKLGDLMLALEMQKRLDEADSSVSSFAVHPGLSTTELLRGSRVLRFLTKLYSNDAATGALPALYAATSPDADSGEYYGPNGFYEMRGKPTKAKVMPQAKRPDINAHLWEVCEEASEVHFL